MSAASGGPVFLMGIDTEDGWNFGHGPESVYANIIDNIISNVNNGNVSGGTGDILVIGGKSGTDTGGFWKEMESRTGNPVTLVSGSTDISNESFGSYAMIAVVSSYWETPSGGLTDSENNALNGRKTDIASFVDGGGGLLGFSQAGLSNPWNYVGDVGSFDIDTGLSYDDVTATSAGQALGITDTNFDFCCLHDVFHNFPGFLDVLATHNDGGTYQGEAAIIGGASVTFQAPNAQCSAEWPGEDPCVSDDITFDASDSTDPDGDDSALTYEWDFGDGTTATGATVTHSFDSEGSKTVTVTVTDEDDETSTCEVTLDVVVCNRPPNAECDLSFDGEVPDTGESITLDGSGSSDPDGDSLTYEWDVDGDGTTDATGETVDYTFSSGGEKTVTLTVTDPHGASDTCELTFTVWIATTIDIKPCSDPNAFNPDAKGVVPVGIKHTTDFDPNDPDSGAGVDSLRFGAPDVVKNGGGAKPEHDGHVEDVVPCDGDGRDDLVVHFPTEDTGFDGDEDMGRLEGETEDGIPLFGEDSVKLAGGGGGNGGGPP